MFDEDENDLLRDDDMFAFNNAGGSSTEPAARLKSNLDEFAAFKKESLNIQSQGPQLIKHSSTLPANKSGATVLAQPESFDRTAIAELKHSLTVEPEKEDINDQLINDIEVYL